jgi:hypothetical protein
MFYCWVYPNQHMLGIYFLEIRRTRFAGSTEISIKGR